MDDLFYNIPLRQNMYNQKESEETKFIILLMQVFSIYYCPKGIQFTLKEVSFSLYELIYSFQIRSYLNQIKLIHFLIVFQISWGKL